jgi:hypothetical protein
MDFLTGKRSTHWRPRQRGLSSGDPEAFLYVDDSTVLEVVSEISSLQRGDHCLTVLNAVRTLSPTVDWLHSVTGKFRLGGVYHHFVLLDDVDHVDEFGVPRTRQKKAVGILEYSNTIQGFLDEAEQIGIFANLFKKANCQKVPLAEYGDMPHLLKVVEKNKLTSEQRDIIVKKAHTLINFHPPYHVLLANCEHTTNLVCTISDKHGWTSPQVTYVAENLLRYVLHGIGLVGLAVWESLIVFHMFTSVPVVVQAGRAHLKTRRSLEEHKMNKTLKLKQRKTLEIENYYRHILVCIKSIAIFHFMADIVTKQDAVFSLKDPLLFHVLALLLCKIYWLTDVLFTFFWITMKTSVTSLRNRISRSLI